MLIGLRAKNFGILGDVTVGAVDDVLVDRGPEAGLTPVTALIGRNSTGKSTVLDALSFLADCLRDGVSSASSAGRRGGFTELRTFGACGPMELEVALDAPDRSCVLDYTLRLACDGHGRPAVESELVRRLVTDGEGKRSFQDVLRLENGQGRIMVSGSSAPDASALLPAGVADLRKPGLSAYGTLTGQPQLRALLGTMTRWYFYRFDAEAARTAHAGGGHRHVSPTGDNLANVVQYLEEESPHELQVLLQRISARMPGLGLVTTSRSPDGKVLLRFNGTDGAHPVYLDRLSDGTLKLFTYLLLMEDPTPRPLVCLEEPESGLYHDMVEPLAAEFRRHATGTRDGEEGAQVLFTTHHPYLLDSLRPEEVWLLERGPDGLASARRAGDDPVVAGMTAQGIGLAALWYGSYLDRD